MSRGAGTAGMSLHCPLEPLLVSDEASVNLCRLAKGPGGKSSSESDESQRLGGSVSDMQGVGGRVSLTNLTARREMGIMTLATDAVR
jgi:hypothetical protein